MVLTITNVVPGPAAARAPSGPDRTAWTCSSLTTATTTTSAARARSATGQISPVTLEAAVTTSSRGPAGAAAKAASTAGTAADGDGGTGSRIVRWRRSQGSSAAWCSLSNTTTVVSGGSAWASRFIASVVLRVKITESRARAPRNSRTVCLACSYRAVVSWDAYPAPRWTLL